MPTSCSQIAERMIAQLYALKNQGAYHMRYGYDEVGFMYISYRLNKKRGELTAADRQLLGTDKLTPIDEVYVEDGDQTTFAISGYRQYVHKPRGDNRREISRERSTREKAFRTWAKTSDNIKALSATGKTQAEDSQIIGVLLGVVLLLMSIFWGLSQYTG